MEGFENKNRDYAIGVMDSGVGGLTVLKQLLNVMPEESYIYFGDTQNLPYGSKSKDKLIKIVKEIFEFFETQNVKAVVLACNTTSATAYEELKDKYSFKIYPLIQSVAKCIAKDKSIERLGVMATEATVKTQTYTKEFKKNNPNIKIIEQACPLWVPIVEKTLTQYDEKQIMTDYLKDIIAFNPQKVILGCTHYPYLIDTISKYAKRELFINPAKIFAEYIKEDLTLNEMRTTKEQSSVHYCASSDPEHFKHNAQMFLQIEEEPELVEL